MPFSHLPLQHESPGHKPLSPLHCLFCPNKKLIVSFPRGIIQPAFFFLLFNRNISSEFAVSQLELHTVSAQSSFLPSIFQCGEQNHITDGGCVGKQHAHAVDADAQTTCWRQAIFQRGNKVFVHWMGFIVAFGFGFHLFFKPAPVGRLDRLIRRRRWHVLSPQ